MYVWRITGPNLPDRKVTARTFDEALGKARKWWSKDYHTGQIIDELDEPDFIGGAPNYDKFAGWEPEQVLRHLNID